jgi:transglutaminase-like putative cysteine protease
LPDGPDDEALRPSLQPAFNSESDEEEIINKARQIAGNERRPLVVCRKLLNWVYHHIEKRPVASIPSAVEVLRTGMGDCNEHATLLTALLRAMGIPARMSSGLVYTRGKFFYHAWTEAYVGSWVTLDATMNQIPVDVTHIKLVQGNLDKQVEIAGLIGKLNVGVLEYHYD